MSAEKLAEKIASINADKELTPEQRNRQIQLVTLQDKLDDENALLEGVGVRSFAGMTRGKGSTVIQWKKFDESKPETHPVDMKQFIEVTGVTSQKDLLNYMITGYNDAQYVAASDPIADYVNPAWDDARQNTFRLVVRNYSRDAGVSIEDAVNLIKPGVEAAFQKSKA